MAAIKLLVERSRIAARAGLLVWLLAALTAHAAPPAAKPERGQVAGITPLPTPIASPKDNRQYAAFKLDNGLRVLLVSDPEQDVAAASLSVSAGSFDDPPSRPGLAHFLEHMLFLGTRRFPNADDYSGYMAKHGGSHNAYTAGDHTNYFFEIAPDAYGEALARFGQFFTAPLFNAIYVDKERNAVHNEYKLHLQDDRWRIQSAKRVAYNPEHPAARNFIGSLDTLSDEQGSVRDDLLDFYAQHYTAPRMVLVLSAPHSLKRLQFWVKRHFRNIPGGGSAPPNVLTSMFNSGQLPALLDIRPQRELRLLEFSFPLPPAYIYYRTKPAQYIASLLGHEGEGSLYAYLKERGWIETVVTRAGNIWRQDAMLAITIGLTEAGAARWREVGDAVFAYIRLLKEGDINAKWRFAEESLLANLAFRYNPHSQPINYVAELSANAFDYPMVDLIRGPFLIDTYAPAVVSQYLHQLTPYRVLITRVTPELETDSKEEWFEVDYKLSRTSHELQTRWAEVNVPPLMRLPTKNEFLPQRLELIEGADSAPKRLAIDRASAWFSGDSNFKIPEAKLYFRLRAPSHLAAGALEQASLALYLNLVDDSLKTFSYPAQLAGLSYGLRSEGAAALISITGYSDRQKVLLTKVARAFTELDIDAERFAILKAALIREWRNTLKADPYARAMRSMSNALLKHTYRPELLAAELATLTPKMLTDWARRWRSELGLSALLVGNLTETDAEQLVNILIDALPNVTADAAPDSDQLVSLEAGGALRQEQVDHNDAALLVYVQGEGQSLSERAHYAVLAQIFRTAYFNELRTERQYGYLVSAFSRSMVETAGIVFLAQSPNADATTLYGATADFLQDFSAELDKLYIRVLRSYKSAVIARLLETDKNLSVRAARYWGEIHSGNIDFNAQAKLAQAVKEVTKKSLIDAFEKFRSRFAHNTLIVYSKGNFDTELNLPALASLTDEDFSSLHERDASFRYQSEP